MGPFTQGTLSSSTATGIDPAELALNLTAFGRGPPGEGARGSGTAKSQRY